MHCCTESRNHHHSSTRKGCHHVLIFLYIKSIDGQFPIQTATHSCDSVRFANWSFLDPYMNIEKELTFFNVQGLCRPEKVIDMI